MAAQSQQSGPMSCPATPSKGPPSTGPSQGPLPEGREVGGPRTLTPAPMKLNHPDADCPGTGQLLGAPTGRWPSGQGHGRMPHILDQQPRRWFLLCMVFCKLAPSTANSGHQPRKEAMPMRSPSNMAQFP